jgi:dTDP-4-amino-4,6-dideoxygalactose transaminase
MVDLAAEYAEVGDAVEEAALRVLRSGRYLLGPETAAFEAEMARLVGVREAVGVGSGTQSLVLALLACGVGAGDEVLTSPFTFFATVEAILSVGAVPVFADIESSGFNVDSGALDALVTRRTRAVVPVHLFGRCADMSGVCAFADSRRLPVIEDAAQAIGASRDGRRAGAWGRAAGFSFYPSKNLGAVGDAGCITTGDPDLAERLRRLRNHGQNPKGSHLLAGTNARIDELQAAVLRAKLPYLERWNERRARNAASYGRLLADCPDVTLPAAGPDETPVWNQFTLRSPRAGAIRRALAEADIECCHYYPRPVYDEPAFPRSEAPAGGFHCPRAERACEEVVSVPVHAALSAAAIERVCEVIRAALIRR